jgi:hypothetical protein
MNLTVDVLDYLGKINNGILVVLSIGYDDDYYEATFYYQEQLLALTPDDKLIDKIGCEVEDWDGYNDLMLEIMKKVVPYDEMINRVDDFDPNKYGLYLDDNNKEE